MVEKAIAAAAAGSGEVVAFDMADANAGAQALATLLEARPALGVTNLGECMA